MSRARESQCVSLIDLVLSAFLHSSVGRERGNVRSNVQVHALTPTHAISVGPSTAPTVYIEFAGRMNYLSVPRSDYK